VPSIRSTVLISIAVLALGVGMASSQTAGGALLYANGQVQVNGQPAGISTSIFSGDKVAVGASSAGSINLAGSSVVVTPNSTIQYGPSFVDVMEGAARVSTTQGMCASAGPVVVSPKDREAKFDVVRTGDKVVAVSRQGALTVKDGNRTVAVPSGSSIELPLATKDPTTAQNSGSNNSSFLGSERLTGHPFYGATPGVTTNAKTLPVCAAVALCRRPNQSETIPCCCPPVIPCQVPQ